MTTVHLIRLNNMPIYQQLQMEEALLRADDRNWCIINEGSSPAIVMGISAKPEQHINFNLWNQRPVPIIRRFSGGGTVFVDQNTSFFTLIGNREALKFPCYPDKLLGWSETLYRPAFQGLDFRLKENDYAIGSKKFGGNALYIQKSRWLLHSSLLWDFKMEEMNYLLMPPKMPAYREKRNHSEFLCRLKDHFASRQSFREGMIAGIKEHFHLIEASLDLIREAVLRDHRRTTAYLEIFKKNC